MRFGGPFGAQNIRGTFYAVGGGTTYAITGTNPPSPGGGDVSYHIPFIYADFETSSSTTVTVTGSQPTYSGTLEDRGYVPSGIPIYQSTNAFSGSYSLENQRSGSLYSNRGYVDFGRMDDPGKEAWEPLFSDSFSVSTWIRPTTDSSNWQYNGIFWNKPPPNSLYNWMLVLGTNADSNTDGSVGWYVTGSTVEWNWFPSASVSPIVQDQWNHIVWAISGAIDGSRSIKAYVNGNDVGTPYKSGGAATGFSNKTISNYTVGLGGWLAGGSYTFEGLFDEVSVWDFELNSGQVSKLYNGGSGKDAMTALTQSS